MRTFIASLLLIVVVPVSASASARSPRGTLEFSGSLQNPNLSDLSATLNTDIGVGYNLGIGLMITDARRRYGILLSGSRFRSDFTWIKIENHLETYFAAPGVYVGGKLANLIPVGLLIKVGYVWATHEIRATEEPLKLSGSHLAGEIAVRIGKYTPLQRLEGFIEFAYVIANVGVLHSEGLGDSSVEYDFSGPRIGIVLGIG